MEFGLFMMPEHFPWDNWHVSWHQDLEEVVNAENLGFDEFWIGEHHSDNYEPVPSPEIMIAMAAAMTKRIKLGTGVINLPYHNDPFLVAERMAYLDNMIKGRLIYGFGGGALPSDYALFNLPREEARPRLDESIEIIRKLLTSREPQSWNGRHYKGENRKLMIGPYKGKDPHFGMAGLTSLSTYEYCGKHGWDALSIYFTPPKFTNNPAPSLCDMGKAMSSAAEAAGRDPLEARRNWKIVRECYVHPKGREAALDEIRAGVANSYDTYLFKVGLRPFMKIDINDPDEKVDLEYMAKNVQWIVGNPQECVDQIHHLYEEVGGFGTLIINNRDWVLQQEKRRSLELFARYVMPRLSGLEIGRKEQRYMGRDFPAPLPPELGGPAR